MKLADAFSWARTFENLTYLTNDTERVTLLNKVVAGMSDGLNHVFAAVIKGVLAQSAPLMATWQAVSPGSRTAVQAALVARVKTLFAGLTDAELLALEATVDAVQAERLL